MLYERKTCYRAVARHDVDYTRRHACFLAQLADIHDRQAGLFGRLEHDAVAGGDRRRDLPDRLQQRIVPRNDAADNAERLAQRHVDVRPWNWNGLTLDLGAHPSEILERVDRGHRVDGFGVADRLAGVDRFQFGELGAVRLNQLRQLHQDFGARGAGLFLPSGEGGESSAHRGVNICLVALG